MGNAEAKNRLFRAISDNDPLSFKKIIERCPHLVDEPISDDRKTTALTRAAFINRPSIISCLVELGADLNKTGVTGITALMWASARGNIDCINTLLDYGANPYHVDPDGLTASDYSVIFGQYESAWILKVRGYECHRTSEELQAIRSKKDTLWVDFEGMLIALQGKLPPEVVPPFTVPPVDKEPPLEDPVADPNEPWKDWFDRVLVFEHPPLVERNSLPSDKQPQNTFRGKIKIMMGIENSPKAREGADEELVVLDAENAENYAPVPNDCRI